MSAADTIYALATGPGTSAIAVIRISGPRSIAIVEEMAGVSLTPRRASRVRLAALDGTPLDDALALAFPEGASFSGEAMAELHVHGGRAVISAVLSDLAGRGLRPAEAGEFTRRAFLNGRLDLVETEGLADLLAAQTEGQRRQALRQLEGAASAVFEAWRKRLVLLLAHAEALIDFSDEAHVTEAAPAALVNEGLTLAAEIRAAVSHPARAERLRDGFRLVLAGAPNAGKSSLFNALLARDAAIVSEIPGTTRDVIEAFLDVGGWPAVISDTAGLREDSPDALEREGIRRSWGRVDEADLVIWVASIDALHLPPKMDSVPLWVWNKADLSAAPEDGRDWYAVSARSGEGLGELEKAISSRLERLAGSGGDDLLITRDRHRQALLETLGHLDLAVSENCRNRPELFAEALRLAARALGRLTGRVDVEDLLDVIFRDFCIGK